MLFAQVEKTFWAEGSGSSALWLKILMAVVVGFGLTFAMLKLPARGRRTLVVGITFLAGLYWVLYYLWPQPLPGRLANGSPLPHGQPRDLVESVGFWIKDAQPVVSDFANILSSFLLGLGVFSIIRIHGRKLFRRQPDWGFSAVLFLAMIAMVIVGYVNYYQTRYTPGSSKLELPSNWGSWQFANDLLFNGLLQQMDAAMFSVIAFYILSAAYRAFRIRSVEATILLSTALIVIFSLMGIVAYEWNNAVAHIPGATTGGIAGNFSLTEIYKWINQNVQTPAIRGIDFGVGIGALAMGLRLWLSLERGGASAA